MILYIENPKYGTKKNLLELINELGKVLCVCKEELNLAICNNMDGPGI